MTPVGTGKIYTGAIHHTNYILFENDSLSFIQVLKLIYLPKGTLFSVLGQTA